VPHPLRLSKGAVLSPNSRKTQQTSTLAQTRLSEPAAFRVGEESAVLAETTIQTISNVFSGTVLQEENSMKDSPGSTYFSSL
jgi:hypothetical protein